jgi:Eukaryotic aspartyl protease
MADPVRLPITAATAGSGYTVTLSVGGQSTQVAVILDTGSSTTAVLSQLYDPGADPAATTTQLLQSSSFGGGGFLAAVVQAPVGLAGAGVATPVSLATANLSVVYNVNQSPFGRAFGILGLAYPALSPANRMADNTWTKKYTQADFQAVPSAGPVAPYLDQLVAGGQITNKFAFSVQRSFRSQAADGDQLNTGYFVLGDCEDCTDLFQGDFASVPIVHESYFSTNLLAIKIGDQTIPVPPLPAGSAAASNSFIDSGCNYLQFESDLYQRVLAAFNATNGAALRAGQAAQAQLNLGNWPNIELILAGAGGSQITLAVAPKDYWQFDSLGPGTARPALSSGAAPYPGQSILGLPLFAGHYVVFDRSGGPGQGVIKFAAQPAADTAPLIA